MNYAANKAANEKRPLPAKLVRDGTHNNTANEKTGEDDRGGHESQRTTFTYKFKL